MPQRGLDQPGRHRVDWDIGLPDNPEKSENLLVRGPQTSLKLGNGSLKICIQAFKRSGGAGGRNGGDLGGDLGQVFRRDALIHVSARGPAAAIGRRVGLRPEHARRPSAGAWLSGAAAMR